MISAEPKPSAVNAEQPSIPKNGTVEKSYKSTPAQTGALNCYRDRRARWPPACIKVAKSKTGVSTRPDHPDLGTGVANLMNALGTASLPFMNGLLSQITNVASQGPEPDEDNINFVLAAVNGVEPRDEIEAMLASQMAQRSTSPP